MDRKTKKRLESLLGRVKIRLDELGWSQAELARRLDMRSATVSNWFTKPRLPGGEVMLWLPDVLGVNFHWLVTGDGPKVRPTPGSADPHTIGARTATMAIRAYCDSLLESYDGGAPLSPEERALQAKGALDD